MRGAGITDLRSRAVERILARDVRAAGVVDAISRLRTVASAHALYAMPADGIAGFAAIGAFAIDRTLARGRVDAGPISTKLSVVAVGVEQAFDAALGQLIAHHVRVFAVRIVAAVEV